MKALLFYMRETSPREAWLLIVWNPLVCHFRGHVWEEHRWYEDGGYLTEHWRDCKRCERYENILCA